MGLTDPCHAYLFDSLAPERVNPSQSTSGMLVAKAGRGKDLAQPPFDELIYRSKLIKTPAVSAILFNFLSIHHVTFATLPVTVLGKNLGSTVLWNLVHISGWLIRDTRIKP